MAVDRNRPQNHRQLRQDEEESQRTENFLKARIRRLKQEDFGDGQKQNKKRAREN